MTCAEFKELCGAYALGAVDEHERIACDAHLAAPAHEGCYELLAATHTTVNAIASFGEDLNGEIYVCDLSGTVYRIDPR